MPWTHGGAGRCAACRLPRHLCVCALAPALELPTRVVVLMHANEWPRASNTGHLVRLALRRSAVRLHGLPHAPACLDDVEADAGRTLVLFPGCGAKPLDQVLAAGLARPCTLIVPDGNWGQTKRMMRRIPLLGRAQVVELAGPVLGARPRPRRNLFKDRMATFEAVAQALGHIEGPRVQDELLAFFCATVDRMLALRHGQSPGPGGRDLTQEGEDGSCSNDV